MISASGKSDKKHKVGLYRVVIQENIVVSCRRSEIFLSGVEGSMNISFWWSKRVYILMLIILFMLIDFSSEKSNNVS